VKNSKPFASLSLACLMAIGTGLSVGIEFVQAQPPNWAPAWGYRCQRGENVNHPGKQGCNRINRANNERDTENNISRDENERDRNNRQNNRQQRKQAKRQKHQRLERIERNDVQVDTEQFNRSVEGFQGGY